MRRTWSGRRSVAGLDQDPRVRVVVPTALVLRVDVRRLRQVLVNLLSNASRHTPPDGEISVVVAATDNEARLTVSNTGSHLTPEECARVFDRFYRTDPSRQKTTGGRASAWPSSGIWSRHMAARCGLSSGPGGVTFGGASPRAEWSSHIVTRRTPRPSRAVPQSACRVAGNPRGIPAQFVAHQPRDRGAMASAARASRNSARVRRASTSSTVRAISSRAAQTTSAPRVGQARVQRRGRAPAAARDQILDRERVRRRRRASAPNRSASVVEAVDVQRRA